MTSKEIAKKNAGALQKTSEIKGLEGFDSELLIVPRLKIVQSMSKEAAPPYEIRVGSLANNLTMNILAEPKTPLKIVPLLIGKSRINFIPIAQGKGINCIAKNNKIGIGMPGGDCSECPLKEWTEKNGKKIRPVCSQYINIPVICPDAEDMTPMMLSFGVSTFDEGRRFTNIMASKRKSPWYFTYKITTKYIEDGDKKYYSFHDVVPAGLTEPGLVDMFESAYEMLTEEGYQVYEEESEETEIIDAEIVDAEIAGEDSDLEI